jgi:uncharacterized repeat protein (TIGR01451 family)
MTAEQACRKRRLARAALLAVVVVLLLGVSRWPDTPTLAQSIPPLAIAKSANPDPVLAGELLYFTLTVTNTGRNPLPEVIVRDEVPKGTTFEGSGNIDGAWVTTYRGVGETVEVLWLAKEPLAPGQAYRVRFMVKVAPEAKGKIINADYRAALDVDGPAVQGPPVVVNIGKPTATPTPSPTPTKKPGPSPTRTPTEALASPTPAATTARPTPATAPTPGGGGCLAGGAALVGLGLSLAYVRDRASALVSGRRKKDVHRS